MDFMDNMQQNAATATEAESAGQQANQPAGQNGADQHEAERRFTQDEVNDIVQKRLAKERERLSKIFQEEKQESDLERREKDLMIRELKADARDELTKKGLPLCVTDILSYDSRESYEQSMEAAENLVAELHKTWEIKRATGRTPRFYANHSGDPAEAIRNAFKP